MHVRLAARSIVLALVVGVSPLAAAQSADTTQVIANYYAEFERLGLIDTETGSKSTLVADLRVAEKLLHKGASVEAAVALFAIVESPRYTAFADFVDYQNAEYDLAVALARSGAYTSALDYLLRVLRRGPSAPYFAPAHRRAVDIALETRDYKGVLQRLSGLKLNEPIPSGALGERAYLRARVHYTAQQYSKAEAELRRISRKSRLYSSALYLRGVIRAATGKFTRAAEALCEVADSGDNNRFTFVVDDRYFRIKDLARLGLARIAHERREYDDAYYHYFQVPDDSDRLPDALFEAAWSMYQKRELATARDLVAEFLRVFPTAPQMPEARLLAGYIELADCKFNDAQVFYDALLKRLQPIADEIGHARTSPERRQRLFQRALARWKAERADPEQRLGVTTRNVTDEVLGLLRLNPQFVRLHDAVTGLRRALGDAPHAVRAWRSLAQRMGKTKVAATSGAKSLEQQDADSAHTLVDDVGHLQSDLRRARGEINRGVGDRTLEKGAATEELQRLSAIERDLEDLRFRAARAAEAADSEVSDKAAPSLAPLISADIKRSRALRVAAEALLGRMQRKADKMAAQILEALYVDTRKVLDKAKLGKIDSVIGQKKKLDIEVQDLAAGRFPTELHGRLWEQGLIGDDEEFWPFEGEYWADEYEGWR